MAVAAAAPSIKTHIIVSDSSSCHRAMDEFAAMGWRLALTCLKQKGSMRMAAEWAAAADMAVEKLRLVAVSRVRDAKDGARRVSMERNEARGKEKEKKRQRGSPPLPPSDRRGGGFGIHQRRCRSFNAMPLKLTLG